MKRMDRTEAEKQIDELYDYYEQGIITAEQLQERVEAVAFIYRMRSLYCRYNVLDRK